MQNKKMLRVLDGIPESIPPLWMMRQAGRYLPEYRALRASAGSFLNLCFSPKLATEVTLQPIRRFGFDAAILFSDILVIPYAMGQGLSVEEGAGPRLSPVLDETGAMRVGPLDMAKLSPVFETIELIKAELPHETALIGFCGAPWTVASYMIAGKSTTDLEPVRLFAYRYPRAFVHLIDRLVEASTDYLAEQARAGVDIVQVFDSWAGLCASDQFTQWCLEPTARIINNLRLRAPQLKIIAFPREAGSNLMRFSKIGADALSMGTSEHIPSIRGVLGNRIVLQGNLDPLALLAGGEALERSVQRIMTESAGTPYIFNLGHGILPETPVSHVEKLVSLVRFQA